MIYEKFLDDSDKLFLREIFTFLDDSSDGKLGESEIIRVFKEIWKGDDLSDDECKEIFNNINIEDTEEDDEERTIEFFEFVNTLIDFSKESFTKYCT